MLAAVGGEYHRLSIVEHGVAEPSGSKRKSTRILVVEDEPSIAGFVRRGLHFEGYDVDVVPDGPGALRRLRESPPDLLVLDVMVPGVDGFEIARRLRSAETAERLPSIPILMLTARDAVADRVTGLRAGADDYLVKPFDFDESWPASRRCCDGPQLQARRSRLARRCSMPISSSISPVAPSAAESATSTSRRESSIC